MRVLASISDLAKALSKHETTVRRNLAKKNARFIWKKGQQGNEKHYIACLLPDEYRLALAAMDGAPIATDLTSIDKQIGAEAATRILREKATEKMREQIAQEQSLEAFKQLPDKRRREAEARYRFLMICNGFVERARFEIRRYALRSKVGDKAFIEAYNLGRIQVEEDVLAIIGKKTSYSTLKRIADAYFAYGLAGLAFGYHNPKRGSTSLTDEQQQLVVTVACQNPQTSAANIRRMLQGQFGREVPSAQVINRYLKKWIKDNQDLWLAYTNPDAWKSGKMFAFGSASEHVERLNQLWEADSTPADLMLTDGRHSLIGMIDVYSRRLRFVVTKTSRASAIIGLTRHCLIEWGVPEAIKTDNGKDYSSHHVERVMSGLGITQIFCTPFQGQEKPHVERAFKTFLHGMVELLPGYIGHNVTERKAIEARRSFAERVMNRESEPVDVAMSSDELQRFCNEWVNFIYHHDPHSGLDGQKPIEMVRGWREPIRRINNLRALDMLLLEAPNSGPQRTITKKGVRVDGRLYQSPDFAGNVGEAVHVLVDPVDMGTVYVYLLGDQGERSFLCAAIDPEWTGIDRAKFSTAAAKHQKKAMREGVAELRKRSREFAGHEAYMEMRRQEVENVIDFPTLGVAYDTPMLAEAEKAVAAVDDLRKEESSLDGLILEIEEEKTITATIPKKEKIVLLRSDSDRYEMIRDQVNKKRRSLTRQEYDFLSEYYQTASGRAYLALQGDMRKEYGLAEQAQAKA